MLRIILPFLLFVFVGSMVTLYFYFPYDLLNRHNKRVRHIEKRIEEEEEQERDEYGEY